MVRWAGFAAVVIVFALVLGVLVSTPGSPVRDFVQELGTETGPIQNGNLRMSILLAVTVDNGDAAILVLAENASDRHIIKIAENAAGFHRPYIAEVTDDLGNRYTYTDNHDVGLLMGHRPDLRPGQFVVFGVTCRAPIERAKYLSIELPSFALGSEEKYRFKVPIKVEPLPEELRPQECSGGFFRWPQEEKLLFKRHDCLQWLKKWEEERKHR
jgi:hypothetical protein